MCHGVTGKRHIPPLELWKLGERFTYRTFSLWHTGHKIDLHLCLQTAWSRLFPVTTLKSSGKTTQESRVPADSLSCSCWALAGPSQTCFFSSFHGERHLRFSVIWEGREGSLASPLCKFSGGYFDSRALVLWQKCSSHEIKANRFLEGHSLSLLGNQGRCLPTGASDQDFRSRIWRSHVIIMAFDLSRCLRHTSHCAVTGCTSQRGLRKGSGLASGGSWEMQSLCLRHHFLN